MVFARQLKIYIVEFPMISKISYRCYGSKLKNVPVGPSVDISTLVEKLVAFLSTENQVDTNNIWCLYIYQLYR